MDKHCIFFALALVFSCCSPNNKELDKQENPFVVMAYYVPEKEYHPDQLPLGKLTHINIFIYQCY